MPADRAAFQKLISVHTIPKTRVTRVTANRINDLVGHKSSAACVTCVTEAPVGVARHKLRDHCEQGGVTGKAKEEEVFTSPGHAVTHRSRRGEKRITRTFV